MPKLIFMYGPPAAGKTTYSIQYCKENIGCVRISADVVRQILYGSEDTYGDGDVIYRELLRQMRAALIAGFDVIYDATNLRKDYRLDYLREIVDIPNCRKEIKCLFVDKDVAELRHLFRGRSIPWEDLEPYFDIDEPPTLDEGWDLIEVVSR